MVDAKSHSPVGDKFCTNCFKYRPVKGGRWKVTRGGKYKRWLCNSCYTKRQGDANGRK